MKATDNAIAFHKSSKSMVKYWEVDAVCIRTKSHSRARKCTLLVGVFQWQNPKEDGHHCLIIPTAWVCKGTLPDFEKSQPLILYRFTLEKYSGLHILLTSSLHDAGSVGKVPTLNPIYPTYPHIIPSSLRISYPYCHPVIFPTG